MFRVRIYAYAASQFYHIHRGLRVCYVCIMLWAMRLCYAVRQYDNAIGETVHASGASNSHMVPSQVYFQLGRGKGGRAITA